jgi:hypothetical protein
MRACQLLTAVKLELESVTASATSAHWDQDFSSDLQFFITTQVKDHGGQINVVHQKATKRAADVGLDLEIFQMAKISFVKNFEVAILQQSYTCSYLLQGTPNSRVEAWFRLGFTIAAGRR